MKVLLAHFADPSLFCNMNENSFFCKTITCFLYNLYCSIHGFTVRILHTSRMQKNPKIYCITFWENVLENNVCLSADESLNKQVFG